MISVPDVVSRGSVRNALWTLGIDPDNAIEINIVHDMIYVDYWNDDFELDHKRVLIA